jgi:hypothetical protein
LRINLVRAVREPGQQEGKQRAKGSVGHQRDAPKQSIHAPIAKARRIIKRESCPQNRHGDQRRKRSVPHAFNRQQDRIGEDGPQPRGAGAQGFPAKPLANQIQRDYCGRAAKNIEKHNREPRVKRIASENAENPREKHGE